MTVPAPFCSIRHFTSLSPNIHFGNVVGSLSSPSSAVDLQCRVTEFKVSDRV
jgi:hypothetical protein